MGQCVSLWPNYVQIPLLISQSFVSPFYLTDPGKIANRRWSTENVLVLTPWYDHLSRYLHAYEGGLMKNMVAFMNFSGMFSQVKMSVSDYRVRWKGKKDRRLLTAAVCMTDDRGNLPGHIYWLIVLSIAYFYPLCTVANKVTNTTTQTSRHVANCKR